ncbi:hypothetical protein FB567DRAFT_511192 [Paraphoma chrysanthemicola]|uniref:Uncharacterized protein n=1 Tax=Paraphoma chrysanthemicola TaxID=798071 RepID=A0A8K0RKE8_9PLEO|nr:hypothetical protein FB567DRAFT_511192 [Paraphoma chrysanthemicola]
MNTIAILTIFDHQKPSASLQFFSHDPNFSQIAHHFTMAFPHSLLSQSTWRNVGLGLTTVFFGLGVFGLVNPTAGGKSLGVIPTTPEGHSINAKGMAFLGIRDVAVASTLFWFYSTGKNKEMGALISSWVLVCVVDTWIAANGPNGVDGGIGALVFGSLVTAFAGVGLFQSP